MSKKSIFNVLIFAAFFATLVALLSCHKKPSCDGPAIYDSFFRFRLVDKYDNNLIAAWGAKYLSDSVFMIRSDGKIPNSLYISKDGSISLTLQDDDNEARDSFVTRQFYLYLPDNQGNPKADIDTIKFRYHFYLSCYDNLQIIYNDSLYHDGSYLDFIKFTKY